MVQIHFRMMKIPLTSRSVGNHESRENGRVHRLTCGSAASDSKVASRRAKAGTNVHWLVVSIPLKHISQLG